MIQVSSSFYTSFETYPALSNSMVIYLLFFLICISLIFKLRNQKIAQYSNSNYIFFCNKKLQTTNLENTCQKLKAISKSKTVKKMFRKQKRENKTEVIQSFMNHCATVIQASFKGYKQRKYYKKFLPLYRRFKQLMYAGFMGWKTRKILNLTIVRSKINKIKSSQLKQKSLHMRIQKRDFSDQITRLLKNDLWLYYLSKEKKIALTEKPTIGNQNQMIVVRKVDLKLAFNIIPKDLTRKNYSRNHINDSENEIQVQVKQNQSRQKSFEEWDEKILKNQQKDRKRKKLQIPPPKSYGKMEKPKQKQLQVHLDLLQQTIETSIPQCKTPSNLPNDLKQFVFHTRPRDPERTVLARKANKEETEQAFKQINVLTHSHKKGLNMTLSKKKVSENHSESISISHDVLKDFTKKKQTIQNMDPNKCPEPQYSQKEVSDFSAFDETKIVTTNDLKIHYQSEQSAQSLALQIKKGDFQKRKMQFQKKSKQFKTLTLK